VALARVGLSVLLLEYRGFGGKPGNPPQTVRERTRGRRSNSS